MSHQDAAADLKRLQEALGDGCRFSGGTLHAFILTRLIYIYIILYYIVLYYIICYVKYIYYTSSTAQGGGGSFRIGNL